MKIIILTLTVQRDQCIDNMLAEELRGLGHDVAVRNYIYAGHESIVYEKPDVIIHPMVGAQYKLDFVKLCKEWGIEVIVRRGEAGVGREQFKQLDAARKEIHMGHWDYRPYVDLELVWGQEFADILAEQGHIHADKLKACGGFAFDPYFPPTTRTIDPNRKRTVLFATGFSTADCRGSHCETGLPEDSDYHEEIRNIHRKARDTWIEAINEFVKWFSDDWAFGLKVRPGEMTNEYVQKLRPEVKIHDVKSSSSEVLRNVDVLVHSGSTMAIEAQLLGIPSFNFCNVNPDPLLASLSPNLATYRELEFHLTRSFLIKNGNINEGVYGELQKHLYGKIDGKAIYNAARFIHYHIKDKEIKTNIPDVWPKTTEYHIDKENVHLEAKKGDVRWLCPCCRNVYWAKPCDITKCPFCGYNIAMMKVTVPK